MQVSRIPKSYVFETQKNCEACMHGISAIQHADQHTCIYSDELYSNFAERIFSPYKHKTDHMCPSHGHNWVHVATMSTKTETGHWTNNCACGWVGPMQPLNTDHNGPEAHYVAREFWGHQNHFCTCYYEEETKPFMMYEEKMAYERDLPFVEISNSLVYATMKHCQSCQNGLSQLEGEHTCMLGTGELDELFCLDNKECPTHRVERVEGEYGKYVGHMFKHAEGVLFDRYSCQACDFVSDSYDTLEGNILATRQMVMHRMEHCVCNFVDVKTWRIKNDCGG